MKAKKSLQKFTDIETKIDKILALEKITLDDIKSFNESETKRFYEVLTDKFNETRGVERDNFYHKIESIISKSTKNQHWEYNHTQITCAISTLMQDYGRMPTKAEVARTTQLSRQTVHKHIKEYSNHPQYLGEIEQFKFMTSKVLAKVFQFAVNGDIAAAKLYFNIMGGLSNSAPSNGTLIQNQNNYIQINGTVLSQETIKQLNPEQLNTIESILKTALPQNNISKDKLLANK